MADPDPDSSPETSPEGASSPGRRRAIAGIGAMAAGSWLPFRLDPTIPPEGIDRADYLHALQQLLAEPTRQGAWSFDPELTAEDVAAIG